jgi:hypothetical protein
MSLGHKSQLESPALCAVPGPTTGRRRTYVFRRNEVITGLSTTGWVCPRSTKPVRGGSHGLGHHRLVTFAGFAHVQPRGQGGVGEQPVPMLARDGLRVLRLGHRQNRLLSRRSCARFARKCAKEMISPRIDHIGSPLGWHRARPSASIDVKPLTLTRRGSPSSGWAAAEGAALLMVSDRVAPVTLTPPLNAPLFRFVFACPSRRKCQDEWDHGVGGYDL